MGLTCLFLSELNHNHNPSILTVTTLTVSFSCFIAVAGEPEHPTPHQRPEEGRGGCVLYCGERGWVRRSQFHTRNPSTAHSPQHPGHDANPRDYSCHRGSPPGLPRRWDLPVPPPAPEPVRQAARDPRHLHPGQAAKTQLRDQPGLPCRQWLQVQRGQHD